MSNSGKSTDRARHPAMRSYRKEGGRLSSCVSLRHGRDAWRAAVSKITERLDRYGRGVHEACPYRGISPQYSGARIYPQQL